MSSCCGGASGTTVGWTGTTGAAGGWFGLLTGSGAGGGGGSGRGGGGGAWSAVKKLTWIGGSGKASTFQYWKKSIARKPKP